MKLLEAFICTACSGSANNNTNRELEIIEIKKYRYVITKTLREIKLEDLTREHQGFI